MKNQWLKYLFGFLKIKVSGENFNSFLNGLTLHNVEIWDVRHLGKNTVSLNIYLRDILKVKEIRRRFKCKVTIVGRYGWPFFYKKMTFNRGLVIGSVCFFLVIFALSNLVWKVEIIGASPQTEEQLEAYLKKEKINLGRPQFLIAHNEEIQRNIMEQLDNIAWVGVDLTGTVYKIVVVEKSVPEPGQQFDPQDIVAKKNGVITEIFVTEGERLVNVNDYVEAGQVLISGSIEKPDLSQVETKLSAQGIVKAETWYKATLNLPLEEEILTYPPNSFHKKSLVINKFRIPLWGFKKPQDANYKVERIARPLYFLNRKLPIEYVSERIQPIIQSERVFTKEAAYETVNEISELAVLRRLDEDAEIKGKNILQKSLDNGTVQVTILFQVEENIGRGQPIIQGD